MSVESAGALGDISAMSASRLARLYEEQVGRAVGLATLLTGDRAIAEDIAHDAFLRVAGRFHDLRDPAAFGPYLRTTVVNMCRARGRRLARERTVLHKSTRPEAVQADESAEDRDQLWGLIKRLPYRQRAALVLKYWEDLSEAQIGQILRCSPRAVNALLSRAKTTLRNDIGGNEG
jgi:RNA polymerase sigma factor (sigma-70 family)